MISRLSDRTLDLVQEALLAVGYDSQAIVTDYDFAVRGYQNAFDKVDLAAFSDPVRHDLHTSCIAAQRVDVSGDVPAILDRMSYLAAPVALILRSDGLDIWPVTRTPTLSPIEHVSYDRLSQYFMKHGRDFHPDALAGAKTKGHQLSFLELDQTLLQFAYEATRSILVERFEDAVGVARDSLGGRADLLAGDLTKAALQILAAAILEDKHLLGSERSATVDGLLQRSAREYGQYFDLSALNKIGKDVGQLAFETLRKDVSFRSFTNEMLGYFYENAFVDEDLRRQLGVYYTPRSIAKRILTRLPVEEIPPADRVVFDGSSGSGNLLLAAFERVGDLLPRGWSRGQRHEYLVQRIHGVDVDQFATQVAALSLFFIDLPAGDAWNVRAADFLSSESMRLPMPATIVVGNPPFKELRSSAGKREQRASLFLSKYLDLLGPGGLLAVILPETFLENSSCRDTRRRLLDECEILELWHLPEGIFPMSNVATVVVIAKKLEPNQKSPRVAVRVERVGARNQEIQQFLSGARPRSSHVVPSTGPWIEDPESRVFSSPLERGLWDVVRVPRRLRDVARIRNGIIPGRNSRDTHFSSSKLGTEWRPWLASTIGLEPYALQRKRSEFVKYPGNLQWPRLDLELVFASPMAKVLVNSGRAPGNPWRLSAAIDDVGVFPSQSFHCVVPKENAASLEEIVAVLNSPVANAWLDSRNRKRWIGENPLGETPFPIFSDRDRDKVISNVRQIMALKQQELSGVSGYLSELNVVRELTHAIDELVAEALGVSDKGRQMLEGLFAGYRRPGIEWRRHSEPLEELKSASAGRRWPVTGQVTSTDAEDNSLMMWVRGYRDDQPFRMPIPEDMPGWALRPGTAFEAKVPWPVRDLNRLSSADLSDFTPLDFAYLRLEELRELLENPMKLDEFYGP